MSGDRLLAPRNHAVELHASLEPLLEEHGVRYVSGDPADESVLRQAGIDRARGLVCAVDSDAANVFITLTARALNPDLRIVARASEAASIDKLVRAGADEVVSPYGLTGRRMAVLAVQPSVLEVLDLLNLGSDIRLEEVAVRAGTHLDSLTIAEARARYAGVAILALKKPGSEVSANPDHQVRLAPGDLIVALGPAEILNRMADYLRSPLAQKPFIRQGNQHMLAAEATQPPAVANDGTFLRDNAPRNPNEALYGPQSGGTGTGSLASAPSTSSIAMRKPRIFSSVSVRPRHSSTPSARRRVRCGSSPLSAGWPATTWRISTPRASFSWYLGRSSSPTSAIAASIACAEIAWSN